MMHQPAHRTVLPPQTAVDMSAAVLQRLVGRSSPDIVLVASCLWCAAAGMRLPWRMAALVCDRGAWFHKPMRQPCWRVESAGRCRCAVWDRQSVQRLCCSSQSRGSLLAALQCSICIEPQSQS